MGLRNWCRRLRAWLFRSAGGQSPAKAVGFDLGVSREALEFLVREGFHPQLGARPLRKTIERHLQDAVVRELLRWGCAAGKVAMG